MENKILIPPVQFFFAFLSRHMDGYACINVMWNESCAYWVVVDSLSILPIKIIVRQFSFQTGLRLPYFFSCKERRKKKLRSYILSTEAKWATAKANPHIVLVANAYHTYYLISIEWIEKNGKLVCLFFTLFSLIIKMIWQISTYPRRQ